MRNEQLRKELASVINRNSRENESNTPDFILAEFLEDCLMAFERTSLAREKWYGKSLSIGDAPSVELAPDSDKGPCSQKKTLAQQCAEELGVPLIRPASSDVTHGIEKGDIRAKLTWTAIENDNETELYTESRSWSFTPNNTLAIYEIAEAHNAALASVQKPEEVL